MKTKHSKCIAIVYKVKYMAIFPGIFSCCFFFFKIYHINPMNPVVSTVSHRIISYCVYRPKPTIYLSAQLWALFVLVFLLYLAGSLHHKRRFHCHWTELGWAGLRHLACWCLQWIAPCLWTHLLLGILSQVKSKRSTNRKIKKKKGYQQNADFRWTQVNHINSMKWLKWFY